MVKRKRSNVGRIALASGAQQTIIDLVSVRGSNGLDFSRQTAAAMDEADV